VANGRFEVPNTNRSEIDTWWFEWRRVFWPSGDFVVIFLLGVLGDSRGARFPLAFYAERYSGRFAKPWTQNIVVHDNTPFVWI
jgi:hypothetical protein